MSAATIDEYLAGVAPDQRAALARLRGQIHEAVPDATETIAYAIPGFRLHGRYLVGFGVTRTACSFYTGRAPIQACEDRLGAYRLQKGTITYLPSEPLPDDLVAALMRVRLGERSRG